MSMEMFDRCQARARRSKNRPDGRLEFRGGRCSDSAVRTILVALLLLGCGSSEATEPEATEPEATEPEAIEPTPEPTENVAPTDDETPIELAPVEDSVRLIVVHETELLPSEERRLEQIAEVLSRGRTLIHEEPLEDETELARAWIDEESGGTHARWIHDETVIVLRIPEPSTSRSGRRTSRGLAGFAIFNPGSARALAQARVDDESAWRFDGETGGWLAEFLETP